MAVPAIAIDAAHPRNADARSQRQFRGRTFDYFSDDLMARNQARSKRRKISFHDVKVSATDSAGDHPQQNMSRLELWTGNIFGMKKRLGRSMTCREESSFHYVSFSEGSNGEDSTELGGDFAAIVNLLAMGCLR
jgi:hypothetical protein